MPSTSANYFHAIRRQLHRSFRKPIVSFNSKKLLRTKTSTLEELAEGTSFNEIYPEKETWVCPSAEAKRVIFCHG
jgi:2-oxoglutarate dehydrogenase E1 component